MDEGRKRVLPIAAAILAALRNPQKDYTQFFVTMRGYAIQWWHFIEQSCVITTMKDADTIAKLLIPHLEKTDSLLVAQITPHQFQGWLPKEAWDWLTDVSKAIDPPAPDFPLLPWLNLPTPDK